MGKSKKELKTDVVTGILVADSWDKNLIPITFKICTDLEIDFRISNQFLDPCYLLLIGINVIAKGTIKIVSGINFLRVSTMEKA